MAVAAATPAQISAIVGKYNPGASTQYEVEAVETSTIIQSPKGNASYCGQNPADNTDTLISTGVGTAAKGLSAVPIAGQIASFVSQITSLFTGAHTAKVALEVQDTCQISAQWNVAIKTADANYQSGTWTKAQAIQALDTLLAQNESTLRSASLWNGTLQGQGNESTGILEQMSEMIDYRSTYLYNVPIPVTSKLAAITGLTNVLPKTSAGKAGILIGIVAVILLGVVIGEHK